MAGTAALRLDCPGNARIIEWKDPLVPTPAVGRTPSTRAGCLSPVQPGRGHPQSLGRESGRAGAGAGVAGGVQKE